MNFILATFSYLFYTMTNFQHQFNAGNVLAHAVSWPVAMTGIHSVQVMKACATVAHDKLLLFMYNMDFSTACLAWGFN
jgi:hypothetical protein